jgi:hypothetical protein
MPVVDEAEELFTDRSSAGPSRLMEPDNRLSLCNRPQMSGRRRKIQAISAFTGPKSAGNQRTNLEKCLT